VSDGAKGFLAGVLLIVCVWAATGLLGDSSNAETIDVDAAITTVAPTTTKQTPTSPSTLAETLPVVQFSDLDPITMGELPPEAVDTINLIFEGGPYPFSKDDGVFQNREGLLPDFERGHYREYTVITPGSDDRGARRIVAGERGEIYFTSDHYGSFREVVS
jgi:ribonuclease T1